MLIQELQDKNLIKPPRFLATNTSYLTIMGSMAYGVSSDSSDYDVYGFCIPPKDQVFPHLAGEIPGFGKQKKRFEQWQEHHINDPSAMSGHGRKYDFTIYSIVKFFHLAMENNANIVDALFTPVNCVLHCTNVGSIVRENRKTFLHKGVWQKMKGYAYSQLHKIATKNHEGMDEVKAFERKHSLPADIKLKEVEQEREFRELCTTGQGGNKRATELKSVLHPALADLSDGDIEEYLSLYTSMTAASGRSERTKTMGFDVKFAYHTVRLLLEAEQILVEHDLDLQRHHEQLKAIRRGEWTEDQLKSWASEKEKQLEKVYHDSTLQYSPDEGKIKTLLLHCLEEHYGNLSDCIVNPDQALLAL